MHCLTIIGALLTATTFHCGPVHETRGYFTFNKGSSLDLLQIQDRPFTNTNPIKDPAGETTECAIVRRLNIWVIIDLLQIKPDAYFHAVYEAILRLKSKEIFPNMVYRTFSITTSGWSYYNSRSPCKTNDCINDTIKSHMKLRRQNHLANLAQDFRFIVDKQPVNGHLDAKLKDLMHRDYDTFCLVFTNGISPVTGDSLKQLSQDKKYMGNMTIGIIMIVPQQAIPWMSDQIENNVRYLMKSFISNFKSLREPTTQMGVSKAQRIMILGFKEFIEKMCTALTKCQYDTKDEPCIRTQENSKCFKWRTITPIGSKGVNDCVRSGYFECSPKDPCISNFTEANTTMSFTSPPQEEFKMTWVFIGIGSLFVVVILLSAAAGKTSKYYKTNDDDQLSIVPSNAANEDEIEGKCVDGSISADNSASFALQTKTVKKPPAKSRFRNVKRAVTVQWVPSKKWFAF